MGSKVRHKFELIRMNLATFRLSLFWSGFRHFNVQILLCIMMVWVSFDETFSYGYNFKTCFLSLHEHLYVFWNYYSEFHSCEVCRPDLSCMMFFFLLVSDVRMPWFSIACDSSRAFYTASEITLLLY
jgi:hypothetical protein